MALQFSLLKENKINGFSAKITESNAKGNDNFATKLIGTDIVEKKCERGKKKESNPFLF